MSFYRSIYLSIIAILFSLMLCLAQSSFERQNFRYNRLVDRLGAQQHYARLLKKSSDVANPQWEDLGWAWGKRSDPVYKINFLQSKSPLETSKRNPDWHDLGWTWGRRK